MIDAPPEYEQLPRHFRVRLASMKVEIVERARKDVERYTHKHTHTHTHTQRQ